MDTPAGYYALAMSRQCKELGESKLMSIAKQSMIDFDEITKQKGKKAACRWADNLEKTFVHDVSH